ncbi:YczE/YyaS/YitT family protein [Sutcliffiella cohnii]
MLKRAVFYLIGLLILSFGVSLTIVSDLGAGAWDALNVGLSNRIGLTVGSWVFIVGIILIVVNAFLRKHKPDYLAVITIFLVGSFIDFWLYMLSNLEPTGFLFKLLVLLAGMTLLSLGIATYLQAKFPVIPIDNLMLALQDRLGFKLMTAKMTGELIALVLALIFGGPIGLGTIIVTFGVGPFIQLFFPTMEKLYGKWMHEG